MSKTDDVIERLARSYGCYCFRADVMCMAQPREKGSEILPAGPTCGMRKRCPLFRAARGVELMMFHPGMVDSARVGCDPFRLFVATESDIDRGSGFWIVRFRGFPPVEVRARSAPSAAIVAWMGLAIDTPGRHDLLLESQYTIREP